MVSELNYMSQVVIMLYEDPTKDPSSDERFHVELHFSPGVNCCVQKNLPPGPGFRPHSRNESVASKNVITFNYIIAQLETYKFDFRVKILQLLLHQKTLKVIAHLTLMKSLKGEQKTDIQVLQAIVTFHHQIRLVKSNTAIDNTIDQLIPFL